MFYFRELYNKTCEAALQEYAELLHQEKLFVKYAKNTTPEKTHLKVYEIRQCDFNIIRPVCVLDLFKIQGRHGLSTTYAVRMEYELFKHKNLDGTYELFRIAKRKANNFQHRNNFDRALAKARRRHRSIFSLKSR